MNRLFGTDGVRAVAGQPPLDREGVLKLGRAAGEVLSRHARGKSRRIVVAKDTRESGDWIEKALAEGLTAAGCEVLSCGVVPTSAVSAVLRKKRFLAGSVISASHNPPEFNGIKFFSSDGKKIPDAWEREIERRMEKLRATRAISMDLPRVRDFSEAKDLYVRFLKKSLPAGFSLRGMKWVLDCANGSASAIAPALFRSLGAGVVATHASPDGKNINVGCGAVHPESLRERVLRERAAGGCAFDGDADRVQFVDEKGELLDGDVLIGLAARHLKRTRKLKNSAVVTTVMANLGFMKAMKELGIKVLVTPVGDRAVSDGIAKSGAVLGGEQSGHIIFDRYLPTGDGLLTALQVLSIVRAAGAPLSSYKKDFPKFPQVLVNLRVREKLPLEKLPDLQSVIRNWEKKLDGNGRILVRYSGTEPLLRVMVEGDSLEKIREIAQDIVDRAKERLA